jgi:hypothetical protein
MKTILILLISAMASTMIICQSIPQAYFDHVAIADSLYNAKNYKASANEYTEAFKANGWKGTSNDRYNAACTWALSGVPDSAFFQLNRIVTLMNYMNYGHITTDEDLVSLHTDARWQPLIN